MKRAPVTACLLAALAGTASLTGAPVSIFNGTSFTGWEGATNSVWRIQDGVIVGGSLAGNPQNEFLATTRGYTNFHLQLDYRLVGTEGFVNGGVQFRSRRIANPPNEMTGFQADIGAGYSGCLYDESRRNRMLAMADTNLVARLEKPGDWNHYEVTAVGNQVTITLNGQRTALWLETDPAIDATGVIALQIHGNCKAEIAFRNIQIEELPRPAIPAQAEILSRFGEGQPRVVAPPFPNARFEPLTNEVLVFVGQENFVRDQKSGELESRLAAGFAPKRPRFRSMAWEADTVYEQWRDLNFGAWTPQLERAGATAVIAQFGQIESLDGITRIPEFVAAYHRLLDQFALRTRRIVLVSPMPFERPMAPDAPDLTQRNPDVRAYVDAIRDLARQRGAVFVDLFGELSRRPANAPRLTDDGLHLNDQGLAEVADRIARLLGATATPALRNTALRETIIEKNRLWYDCWRPANWSFVYGDRVSQIFAKGAGNEPSLKEAFEQYRPLIATTENRIHDLALGKAVEALRPATSAPSPSVDAAALSPEEQLATFTPADGFEVNLFASERDGVVKPTQISWDERGRLYIACSPTYPQSRASTKPADYILVLHDTNGDGRSDTATRFAEGLTMVQGVEPYAGGVLVCDFDQILHLKDTNGDGRADSRKVLLSGFGVGDTHQLVNSITHGPDGSLWFTQGLHAMSRVETPWGIARLDRAAVWRLRPRSLRLDGFFGGGMAGANCWGVAFDDFGQVFHKSGDRPHGYWTVPGMVRGASPIGGGSTTSADASYANTPDQYHPLGALFETSPKTTSLDIIGTRALPDELQGCALIGGYFGALVEAHRFEDSGAGFKTTQLPRLLKSSNGAFRPVDVSVGPDGAIYIADWFNPLIGHYQTSYVDPKRDKTRGRIWRLTAKGRPLVRQPDLASMKPAALLEQLKSPERWTRQQAKRLLFDAPTTEVLAAADAWLKALPANTPGIEHVLLELTGVYEAHEAPRPRLLERLLNAHDPRVRAYGARVAGMWADRLPDGIAHLVRLAQDENPRVRLEAVVASTYAQGIEAVSVAARALDLPQDPFLKYAIRQAARALQPRWAPALAAGKLPPTLNESHRKYLQDLAGAATKPRDPGLEVYEQGCLPCHQPEGKGLPGVYPPLAGSEWVRGDADRLVRIVLHGLTGPVTVAGANYGGPDSVPMPSMAGLTDEQIADVLTYVRREFGNGAPAVPSAAVKRVRESNATRIDPWKADELGMGAK
jgi:putative membrane-bound dehydrogenase-like protein